MKHHIALKFLAIVLCACCLLCSVASAAGIIFLSVTGLYESEPDTLFQNSREQFQEELAYQVAYRYAASTLGNCPEHLIRQLIDTSAPDSQTWGYAIADETGKILCSDPPPASDADTVYTTIQSCYYPTVLSCSEYYRGELLNETTPTTAETLPQSATVDSTVPQETTAPEVLPGDFSHTDTYGYRVGDSQYVYQLGFQVSPNYTVTLHLLPGAYAQSDWEQLVTLVWQYRNILPVVLAASLLLCAIFYVYLCCAAAKQPGRDTLRPGGLNRLPLDVYAAAVCAAGFFGIYGLAVLLDNLFDYLAFSTVVLLVVADGFFLCLLVVAFLFACAAQFKMGDFYWWKHSLTGTVLRLAWNIFCWAVDLLVRCLNRLPGFVKKGFQLILRILKTLWRWTGAVFAFFWNGIQRCVRWLWKQVGRFCQLLPLTWQWLLTGCGMGLLLLIGFCSRDATATLLAVGICAGIVLYGTYAFGNLLAGAKRMSQGDLDTKVNDSLMLGAFRDFSGHLNDLAGVATVAAQKQMRSERMKAELVTNVSHDIKTPLTSIINYVDLLQKAKSQAEAEEYLEVLSRQSQRMKKLIDDLMEMSKASTGNLPVDIAQVDAVEAVNQALGEFSDKLTAAQLTPIFQAPEKPIMMKADGRLAWRVLSNLLSNAVKYALPGTRLYVDLVQLEGQVLISLKNISREPLNVSSDELMERFVRGDASRNTEGSGLGLNIAKNLMEVQGGHLQLLIDGDLFKATLVFPAL